MPEFTTLQELFRRYRRPGDIVFAAGFLVLSLILLMSLPYQVAWVDGVVLPAQPAFWPMVAVAGMTVFGILHYIGSLASPRIPGRWTEVWFWVRALEYAAWFMAYVVAVPRFGYLVVTMLFCGLLAVRVGYRGKQVLWGIAGGIVVVLLFKTFLGVHVPGGDIYRYLPAGPRAFMLNYF